MKMLKTDNKKSIFLSANESRRISDRVSTTTPFEKTEESKSNNPKLISTKKTTRRNTISKTQINNKEENSEIKTTAKIETPQVEKFIEGLNQPILINNLNRPFSILIKQLEMNDKPHNSAFENSKEKFVVFLVKAQIFCGSEAFSNPRSIKWVGLSSDQNPLLNRRIYFSVPYKKLPMFASILIKVKLLRYNKSYQLMKHETIAWANFRLFDHARRLKTGKYLIINQGFA